MVIFVGLLLVLGGVVAIAGRRRGDGVYSAMPIALAIVLAVIVGEVVRSPGWTWNSARTAPAVALFRHGVPLYSPQNSGAILNFLYGPLAAVVLWPAVWVQDPVRQTQIAAGVCAVFYFGGALAFLKVASVWRGTRPGLAEARPPVGAMGGMTAFVLLAAMTHATGSLNYSAFRVHADAPAAGFEMLSLAMLVMSTLRPANRRTVGASFAFVVPALFAVAAVACKQTLAPLLLILPAWLLVTRGWKFAAAMAGLIGLFAAAAFGIVLAFPHAMPLKATIFNMITVPKGHGWEGHGDLKPAIYLARCGDVVGEYAWIGGLLAVAIAVGRHRWRTWTHRPWALPLVVGIAMLPTSTAASCKIGAGTNSLTPAGLPLLVAAIVALDDARRRHRASVGTFACVLSLALTAMTVLPWEKSHAILHAADEARSSQLQQAYDFARLHPRQVYAPWLPLATLATDGRVYPFEYGVFDRELAGRGPTKVHVRESMPSELGWVIVPPRSTNEVVKENLREFSRRTKDVTLKGWTVLRRERK